MAMLPIFTLDGKSYPIGVVSLKRKASVLDTDKSGRVKSGDMERDIIGTYYNYELSFGKNTLDPVAYDALYEALTAPVPFHTVSFPYGSQSLTFQAYVSNATDDLTRATCQGNRWANLSVSFVAKQPSRRAL